MTDTVHVSAPGSIMMTGEHAVVYGAPSVVCAIEQRIHVRATPLEDKILDARSEIAPPLICNVDTLPSDGPYRFVCRAVKRFAAALGGGVKLEITSQIDPTLGLGSSAAVTVATLGALARLSGGDDQAKGWQERLHSDALAIVRQLQGRGSGADLGASLFGGMISYQLPQSMLTGMPSVGERAIISRLGRPPAMGLCYCGYKTPTGEVLAKIAADSIGREPQYDALYDQMGENADACIASIRSQDWVAAGQSMNAYQGLMVKLGVSDAKLNQLVAQANDHRGVLGAKISGSGLGDCVLAFGGVPDDFVNVKFADTGLRFHD